MRSRARVIAGLAVAVAAAVAAALTAPSASATSGWTAALGRPAAAVQQVAAQPVAAVGSVGAGQCGKPAVDPVLAAAAKRFGLSAQRLEQALRDVKTYLAKLGTEPKVGLLDPGVVAVFAKSLGISVQRARAVLTYLSAAWKAVDKGKPGTPALPPAAVAFFAKTLHVSVKRAQVAFDQLMKLAAGPKGSVNEKDPGFIKVARSLGVTPKQLTAALVALKKFLSTLPPVKGKPGDPCKPGQPKPGDPGKPTPPKPGAPGKPAQPLPVG